MIHNFGYVFSCSLSILHTASKKIVHQSLIKSTNNIYTVDNVISQGYENNNQFEFILPLTFIMSNVKYVIC